MERQSVTMKQRPETERPYEKCLKAGAESLTDGELLAVLIRCGTKNYSALELAFALLDRHPVYKGLAGLYHLDSQSFSEGCPARSAYHAQYRSSRWSRPRSDNRPMLSLFLKYYNVPRGTGQKFRK